jgi:hypothetical protein
MRISAATDRPLGEHADVERIAVAMRAGRDARATRGPQYVRGMNP